VSEDLNKAAMRSTNDQAYRAELLHDSLAARGDAGVDLPEGIDVKVVENEAAIVYLVLPEASDDDLGLTAAELERVAAGITQAQLSSLLKVAGPRH
jgi:hypothetical protein